MQSLSEKIDTVCISLT